MLKTAFVGAGRRAQQAHYPTVSRLEDARIEAVAELDESRMGEVVDSYAIPRAFGDYREMVETVDPDLVYVIMGEELMASIAIDCMNSGRHVFIEKPAGASPEESHALRDAAEANGVVCAVGFQRRFADVTREAMRLVADAGGPTLAVGEFHKDLLGWPKPPRTTIWNDVCHAVDMIRYMAGSEVTDATAFQDARGSDWRNDFTALMRFRNGATGVLLANRSSGGRTLRAELHGIGVGCYMRVPDRFEVLKSGQDATDVHGSAIQGVDAEDSRVYDGTLEMHRHVAESIAAGRVPINDIRDVVHTSDLVARLEGGSVG